MTLNSEHKEWGWLSYYKRDEDGVSVPCLKERKGEATLVKVGTYYHSDYLIFELPGQRLQMNQTIGMMQACHEAGQRAARARMRAALAD